jgi:hypothetical protein
MATPQPFPLYPGIILVDDAFILNLSAASCKWAFRLRTTISDFEGLVVPCNHRGDPDAHQCKHGGQKGSKDNPIAGSSP